MTGSRYGEALWDMADFPFTRDATLGLHFLYILFSLPDRYVPISLSVYLSLFVFLSLCVCLLSLSLSLSLSLAMTTFLYRFLSASVFLLVSRSPYLLQTHSLPLFLSLLFTFPRMTQP